MKMSTDINESNSDMSDSEEIEDENLSEVDNDVEDDRVIDSDEEVIYNYLIFNINQVIDLSFADPDLPFHFIQLLFRFSYKKPLPQDY